MEEESNRESRCRQELNTVTHNSGTAHIHLLSIRNMKTLSMSPSNSS